jgi:cobalt-zinc-cadmium efflux system membrane fusion protein
MKTAAFALLALFLGGCRAPAAAPAASEPRRADCLTIAGDDPRLQFVHLETVTLGDDASTFSMTGKISFDEDHTQRVASPVDGRVVALLVKPGDHVTAGQPLVELSSPQVAQFESDAQKARYDHSVAEKARDRAHKLAAEHAISDREVAQVEADERKARSEVARTEEQLKSLGINPTAPNTRVALRARVSGTVVERNVLLGQEVRADATDPLLTITSLDNVWVLADVYEPDLRVAVAGIELSIRVPAYPGQSFKGVITYVGDVVDPITRTIKVRGRVPNPDGRLKPEMFARVDLLDAGGRKALTLPAKAVLTEGAKVKVVVARDGSYCVRTVETGNEEDGHLRIFKGLEPGEVVATDGALFLKQEIEGG